MAGKNPVIKAETRDRFGKGEMHRMRNEGFVPGVVYGPDEDTVSLMVNEKELSTLLGRISIENTIVDLQLSGGVKKSYQTLIREVQRHPFKSILRHVDFYCVPKGRKIPVEVPIVLHGHPIGVTQEGGIIQQALRELEIMVLPTNIPEQIDVNIGELHLHDSIHVADLTFADFEVLTDPKRTIVSIIAPALVPETVTEGAEVSAVGDVKVIGEEEEEKEEEE